MEKNISAYVGDENYIFVSYAHKDKEIVLAEIKRFHDRGYPIWYDRGLTAGQAWDQGVAEALVNSSLVVVFISKNAMASVNVQDEIKMALNRNMNIAPIYLEDVELPLALELRLGNKHAIFKHMLSHHDYINDCVRAFKLAEIPKIKFNDNEMFFKTTKVRKKVSKAETLEFSQPMVLPAYDGDEDYIFVSYAHMDTNRIFPEIMQFQKRDYNIWYDDQSNTSGKEWEETKKNAMKNSSFIIFFITNNSIESINIHETIDFAIKENIPILLIYLEDTELKYGLNSKLEDVPSILKYSISDEEYVEEYVGIFNKYLRSSQFDSVHEDTSGSSNQNILILNAWEDIKIADDVCKFLESNNISCWVRHRDGDTGMNLFAEFRDGFENTEKCVVIFSNHVPDSNDVINGVKTAIGKKMPVISFNIDDSPLGSMEDFLKEGLQIDAYPITEDYYDTLLYALNNDKLPDDEDSNSGFDSMLLKGMRF